MFADLVIQDQIRPEAEILSTVDGVSLYTAINDHPNLSDITAILLKRTKIAINLSICV